MIALDSGPRDIELAAAKFQGYLLEERLIGGRLTVQVLFSGKLLARHHVAAANRLHGDIHTRHARTDAQGRATFELDRGDWMIRLVHMEPSTQQGADWPSWWTSLTFSRAAP